MQDFERITSFINSFNKDDEGLLGEIYKDAVKRGVPVIRRESREVLKMLLLLNKPIKILEVGTAVGYSSLYMSKYLTDDAHITTIEIDEIRADEARCNIEKLGKSDVIQVITGDANDVLRDLVSKKRNGELDMDFDFAFVDAAKGQYVNYYEPVMELVKTGGIILSDNVLSGGEILESHFLVTKRDRTIHDRMRDYLYQIKNDERIETTVMSVGDGLAVSIRK